MNVARISTDTLEADYTNNYDTATTIIGDFPNAYTTIDCPPTGSIGGEVTCAVTVGNNGNTSYGSGTLELWINENTPITQAVWSGMDLTCTTDTSMSPQKLICTGGDLAVVTSGTLLTGSLTLTIEEDYNLLANPTSNRPVTMLPVSSHIIIPQVEVTTTDNHAYDEIMPVLRDRSSIAGRTYIDTDDSKTYTIRDQIIRNTEVCATGTDTTGTAIDICQTSNDQGEYVISGLLPGNYQVQWNTPSTYT